MTTYIVNNETIHVKFDSQRHFWGGYGFVAVLDSYDPTPIDCDTPARNPVGEGNSEEEALEDLLAILEEMK